jgi:hypothetical protein
MRFFLFWFLLSLMVSIIAREKGRSPLAFFFLAMIFSPLIGFLAALFVSPSHEIQNARGIKNGTLKKCPFCSNHVKMRDSVCRYCGKALPEIIDVEVV